jgi:hypothetical protein
VNDCDSDIVDDHANFQRFSARGRTDQHGDIGIISFEGLPVISKGVDHVIVSDSVFAG